MFCSQYFLFFFKTILFVSMPWLETSNFMIIPCIWKKIWDRTVENTLMLPMLLSYGPVVHYGVCSTRGTGNRHWTWQTTMVEPDGWRAIGNDFVTRSRVCVCLFVFFIHSARFHSFECYTANAQQTHSNPLYEIFQLQNLTESKNE